jgi:aminomethyltransferase
MLCNPDGGVVDDLIVYRNSSSDLFLIPNASNTTDVVSIISAAAPVGIEVVNLHEEHGVLALQGPKAAAVIESLGVVPTMDYMAFSHVTIAGCDVILCRTGYTGEHGYELVPTWKDASQVWDALVTAMAQFDGVICGLGARDTLRTEMGYPLHGHELSLEITPVQAGSTWAVGWKKESFRGSDALRAEKESGPRRILRGLQSTDRGIPRAGMDVKNSDGEVIGVVTSGTFSPSLKKGIALALVEPSYAVGDSLIVDVRGRDSISTVVALPMVESHVR